MNGKIYKQGTGKILIVLLTMTGESELEESVIKQISEGLPDAEITMKIYETENWDADFSIWEYRMPDGDRYFEGKGTETLNNIKELVSDEYESTFIAGYSLAGLFSLWALHETDVFDGCACCSGSLWFGGWEEYSEKHNLKKPGIVYMSLGGKEDKAKDPTIATIGCKTRNEDKRLDNDPMVKKHTFVMNPGGHFSSPDKRLAQGIIWLIEQTVNK